ncbi:hypothetical protein Erwinia_phage_Papaline_00012 [Erwinia phage Papaline]|nr:hypothetical protein Erwinia_phage_Papaline_00012 [Erwinia phage Papaline]
MIILKPCITCKGPKDFKDFGSKNKCKSCIKLGIVKDYQTDMKQEKRKVNAAFNNAVRRGELVRPEHCSRCGGSKPQGHHEDYSRPFDVMWLCQKCHSAHHRWKDENILLYGNFVRRRHQFSFKH